MVSAPRPEPAKSIARNEPAGAHAEKATDSPDDAAGCAKCARTTRARSHASIVPGAAVSQRAEVHASRIARDATSALVPRPGAPVAEGCTAEPAVRGSRGGDHLLGGAGGRPAPQGGAAGAERPGWRCACGVSESRLQPFAGGGRCGFACPPPP